MKETTIRNELTKYFKTADNALGFYANLIKKPQLGKEAVLATVNPRVAARLANSIIGWYVLGISEDGVFYSKDEVKALGEAEILAWEEVAHVEITEGFMANSINFTLTDGPEITFKILKTLVGLNHNEKTQKLKVLLQSINKLKNN